MIDGAFYSGEMKKFSIDGNEELLKHGNGTQTWPDGAKYCGSWYKGKAQGHGKFFHANGDVYDGEFYEDRANGYGMYTHNDG